MQAALVQFAKLRTRMVAASCDRIGASQSGRHETGSLGEILRGLEVGNRFVVAVFLRQCCAEKIMSRSEAGIELNHFVVLFDGAIILPRIVVGETHESVDD